MMKRLYILNTCASNATQNCSWRPRDLHINGALIKEQHDVKCVCLFTNQSRGGQPKKTYTGKGRPKNPDRKSHFSSLQSQMEDQKFPVIGIDCNFCPTSEVFNCKICTHFLKLPVALPCEHIFCLQCVKGICDKEQQNKYICPICTVPFKFVQVEQVKDYFMETLLTSSLQCNTCNEIVTLPNVTANMHTCDPDAVTKGIHKFLGTPLTTPLSPTLEKLGTHILKSKLTQSADHMSASFKTGGQVSI